MNKAAIWKLGRVEQVRKMEQQRGYQRHLSQEYSVLKEVKGRSQKFNKILSILRHFQISTPSLQCLDIGCSSGIITSLLGEHFLTAIGIDIDQEALRYARSHSSSSNVHFLVSDSMALPFKDNTIEVIICNHVYEHVPDANRMMREIYRVLKKEGFCYFSAGNKYMVMEGHYYLPFLSWIPRRLAHFYLKITRRGNFYYEEHLSLRGLRRLVTGFEIHDYTLSTIRDPQRFFATDLFNTRSFLYKCIRWLAPYLYSWIPTYVWILKKK
jgi:ubiquinone/menaquinone biosynthesis C-methylase UbiE